MYSGFISMKSLGLGHMATTWKPLWKYGILMKDSQAKAQKPVQIRTNCFSRTSLGKSNQLDISLSDLRIRMISLDAHLFVLRKSILVFTDLMKTACSDGELVCSLCWSQLRCCSNPLIRICLSHLSVFMFCSLSVSSLCFLFNEDCLLKSGRRLLFLLSSTQGVKVWLVSIKGFYYTWRKLSVSIHLNDC